MKIFVSILESKIQVPNVPKHKIFFVIYWQSPH
jgi:hypothetical protein